MTAGAGEDLIAAAIENAVEPAPVEADIVPKPRLLVEGAAPDSTVEALRDLLARSGELYDRGVRCGSPTTSRRTAWLLRC